MSGLTKEEKARLHGIVLSEANGHEFTPWVMSASILVACRKCGVMRSNEMIARFKQPCKGSITVDLRENIP